MKYAQELPEYGDAAFSDTIFSLKHPEYGDVSSRR